MERTLKGGIVKRTDWFGNVRYYVEGRDSKHGGWGFSFATLREAQQASKHGMEYDAVYARVFEAVRAA